MSRWFVFLLFLTPCAIQAQPDDFLSVKKTSLENYSLAGNQFFDGKSIWGYMDGGADLYLEYGFEGLLVEQINYKGLEIKCEIFKMTEPVAAFGIFSIQRHNCIQDGRITSFHCINNYQVQIEKGNYYISVINQVGDSVARMVTIEVASKLSAQVEDKPVQIPESLKNFLGYERGSVMFLKGDIALGNVYPQALKYMENTSDYKLWMIPSQHKHEPDISLISFGEADGLAKYILQAFPGISDSEIFETKLKGGNRRLMKKLNGNTVIQLEGKISRDYRKMIMQK